MLGAGTMGAQIAALLAGRGILCDLLDLPARDGRKSRLAEEAKRRLLKAKPTALEQDADLQLIRPGNFSDDMDRVKEADWVIEAVTEDLDIKRSLWARVAPHLRQDALASTNTSGIPIVSIAEGLSDELRRRFLGAHFSNPPRYLRLLEVIPLADTDPESVSAVRRIGEDILGRGVVVAHDVPGFIANRIGIHGVVTTLRAMEEFGLGPDEVDGITGRAMGRPDSATFRTLDLVGLDVFVNICDNMRAYLTEPDERAVFHVPPYVREMVERGWTGEKAGQGFYKRVRGDGKTQILALHLDTFEYRPRRQDQAPSLAAVRDIADPGKRLQTLVGADDHAGRFAWEVISQLLVYAARNVGEVSEDIISIDRAMRWGFGWQLGPFEAWDELGVKKTAERMRRDEKAVPPWVEQLVERGRTFYVRGAEYTSQVTPRGEYVPIAEEPRTTVVTTSPPPQYET